MQLQTLIEELFYVIKTTKNINDKTPVYIDMQSGQEPWHACELINYIWMQGDDISLSNLFTQNSYAASKIKNLDELLDTLIFAYEMSNWRSSKIRIWQKPDNELWYEPTFINIMPNSWGICLSAKPDKWISYQI